MVKVTRADGDDEDGDADVGHDNGDSADHDDVTEQKWLCASYWNSRLFGDNKSHRELMVVSCSMLFSSLHMVVMKMMMLKSSIPMFVRVFVCGSADRK